jgi:hypothetical protein
VTVTLAALGIAGLSPSIMASHSFKAAVSPGAARAVISNGVFGAIELTFTPKNGGNPITKNTKRVKETVELPPGTYTLAVSALVGDSAVADGATAADSVVVRTGKTTAATVNLTPATGGALDAGVFSYDLTLPEGLTSATLILTDQDGNPVDDSDGAPVGPVDLLATGAKGVVEKLPPGEYRLTVFLEDEEKAAPEFSREVYVYSTLQSVVKQTFPESELSEQKYPVELIISLGPSTLVGDIGPLSFKQGEEPTLTVADENFETIAWNLDGAPTTAGVSGANYTPPTTLKLGTHFVTVTAKANGKTYSQIVEFTVTN